MPIELKEYDPGPFFDEMMAGKNRARPLAKELIGLFRGMGDDELSKRQDAADLAIKEMGITFTVYSENEGMIDRNWPFDIVPRIIDRTEWDRIEAGLKQRVRALNMFIDDLYHEQKIIKGGVFPARPRCWPNLRTSGHSVSGSRRRSASGHISAAPTWCVMSTAPCTCSRTTCESPPGFRTCSRTAW